MRDDEGPVRMPSLARLSPYLVWLAWIVWLPFLALDVADLIRVSAIGASFFATLVFIGLFALAYAWATLRNVRELFFLANSEYRRKSRGNWPIAAFLTALSAVLALLGRVGGHGILSGFIFTSAYIGGAFSWRRATAANLVLLGLCMALNAAFKISDAFAMLFLIPVVCFMVMLVRWSLTAGKDLRAAQEEISRLAVSAERLRIARDLHDLLGHALSLIILKSELAGRLIAVSPERAGKEIGDVENAARSMLQEVREALSNYRRPELAVELRSARNLIEAAGLSFSREADEAALIGLPPEHDEALAWTLREGVTNLVRHSRAKSCKVLLRREDGRVAIEIIDDGRAPETRDGAEPARGTGLAGLKERADILDGRLEAGFREGGGFRLSLSLPLPPDKPRKA